MRRGEIREGFLFALFGDGERQSTPHATPAGLYEERKKDVQTLYCTLAVAVAVAIDHT